MLPFCHSLLCFLFTPGKGSGLGAAQCSGPSAARGYGVLPWELWGRANFWDIPWRIWHTWGHLEQRNEVDFFECKIRGKKGKTLLMTEPCVPGGWWLKRLQRTLLTSAPGCKATPGLSTSTAPSLWSASLSWTVSSSATSTTSDTYVTPRASPTGPSEIQWVTFFFPFSSFWIKIVFLLMISCSSIS